MAFPARYPGRCSQCGNPVNRGDMISWSRREKSKVYHESCSLGFKGDTPEPGMGPEPDIMNDPAPDPLGNPFGDAPPFPSGDDPLAQAIARAVQAHIKPGVDEAKVRAIVRDESGSVAMDTAKDVKDLQAAVKREQAKMAGLVLTMTVNDARTSEPTFEGVAHHRFPILLRLLNRSINVYLHGDSGSGKSTAAEKAATALGLPYYYMALGPQDAPSKIMGFIDAHGKTVRTVAREAYEHGGVLLLDEGDNASAALLVMLNSMIENGQASFPDGLVNRHEDFRLVMTGNTAGRPNPMFPERRPFDAAFASRFVYLEWNVDLAFERVLALAHNADAGKWVDWVQSVREYVKRERVVRAAITPRESITGAKLLADGFQPSELADMLVFERVCDADTKLKILANCPLPKDN